MFKFFNQYNLGNDATTGTRKGVRSFRSLGKWFPLEGVTFADVLDYSSPVDICKACGIEWHSPERLALMGRFANADSGVVTINNFTFWSYDRGQSFKTAVPAGTRLFLRTGGDAHNTAEAWAIRPDRVYGIKAGDKQIGAKKRLSA
jgi:hypothetical protein